MFLPHVKLGPTFGGGHLERAEQNPFFFRFESPLAPMKKGAFVIVAAVRCTGKNCPFVKSFGSIVAETFFNEEVT